MVDYQRIKEPGKYLTMAGQIAEVLAVRGDLLPIAVGFVAPNDYGCVWKAENGKSYADPRDDYDIIGPYVEPPKLREVWVEFTAHEVSAVWRHETPNTVHFREVAK